MSDDKPIADKIAETLPEGTVVIEVTTAQTYIIPANESINGWSTDQIIEEWFRKHRLSSPHAGRDARLVGGSQEVKNIRILEGKG